MRLLARTNRPIQHVLREYYPWTASCGKSTTTDKLDFLTGTDTFLHPCRLPSPSRHPAPSKLPHPPPGTSKVWSSACASELGFGTHSHWHTILCVGCLGFRATEFDRCLSRSAKTAAMMVINVMRPVVVTVPPPFRPLSVVDTVHRQLLLVLVFLPLWIAFRFACVTRLAG